jgi:hypothetical protein
MDGLANFYHKGGEHLSGYEQISGNLSMEKFFSNHQFKKAQYGSVCIKKMLLFVKKF